MWANVILLGFQGKYQIELLRSKCLNFKETIFIMMYSMQNISQITISSNMCRCHFLKLFSGHAWFPRKLLP